MKTCSRCGAVKATEEFQVRRASHDGMTAACKACLKLYDATRAMLPHRVAARTAYQQTDAGKAAVKRAHKASDLRLPDRRAARIAVGNSVRDGRLKPWPACALEDCGALNPVAHHPDYSRPLDVVWLCPPHHKQAHALFTRLTKVAA